MRRTTTLTAATMLGLAVLVPTTSATAAGETCRGEAATIVGTGPTLTGTEGRDVIVTADAGVVDSLGGDDLICIVPARVSSNVLLVVSGAGADVVDTAAVSDDYYVDTVLGAGADTFVGGAADDTVYAGEKAGPQVDTERDTIDTGAGGDTVITGSTGTPDHDVVRLGSGRDYLTLRTTGVASDAVLDGGPDVDSLRLYDAGEGDLALDMAAATFTGSQGTAAFSSFEASILNLGAGTFTYRGTAGPDSLDLWTTGTPTLDVATGGGNDTVTLAPATITAGSRLDTGGGRDRFVAGTETGRLTIDLDAQLFTAGDVTAPATGVEEAFLMAPSVVMTGSSGDDELDWSGCDARVSGGAGDDAIGWQYDYVFETYEFRCRGDVSMSGGDGRDSLRGSTSDDRLSGGAGRDTIEGRGGDDRVRGGAGNDTLDGGEGRDDVRGQGGADVLKGKASADVLLGGSGRDRADGSGGRDRCVAEREKRCER
jgi:hypothetical protein